MAEERTFLHYEDVKVTNARFMVGSQTFAMSNITSVKASKEEPSPLFALFLLILGIGILLGAAAAAPFGIACAIVGGVWLAFQKTVYHVMLTTAGGETSALKSNQREYIEKVVQALNDAIVARG